jgi:integration host factor subunit beta
MSESPPNGRTGPSEPPRTVTKKELVARIAEKTRQTKVVAKDVIQCFLDEIVDELGRGNRLEFREFGVFELQERAARKALNPRTRERVGVPSRHVVKFKVGRLMKERVRRFLGEAAEDGDGDGED